MLGAALLAVAVPLIVAFAVAVLATLRTNPFFTQTRVGRGGRLFRFLKVRTLPASAPAYADKYEIERVHRPRVCTALRSSHLDELPQLLLVLKGEMSLVGPRPEMPHLHEQFLPAHRAAREALRPGCAGLWQVSVDNNRLIGESPEYDLFYARHVSWRLDLWVLWRTALLVIGGRRITLDDVPGWARRDSDRAAPDVTPGLVHEDVESRQPALVA